MKCPHCLIEFHDSWRREGIGSDSEGIWSIHITTCPSCGKFVIRLWNRRGSGPAYDDSEYLVRPKTISRSPVPKEVSEKFAQDYREACLILSDSPKASGALSRRCLQNLLREIAGVKPSDLADEIQQVIDSKTLPSDLFESIDYIRIIGNFSAHPIKSKKSGEIVDVEPGEAEWSLDVLESLFDFYFVRPLKLKEKRAALDQKLKDSGKPPMK
ncbi:MAG: DUF4145 domain-containing protein [Candidatus Omnitrophota bacterium]|nr:DUF4145 domain-containing protein [Candidatus Omnitrophota bacterium]